MAGFLAKFLLFKAVLEAGGPAGVRLAVAAAINSAIALYYYARIVQQMYLAEPSDTSRLTTAPALSWACAATAGMLLVIGLVPAPWLLWTMQAILR